jgi:hypothetical protein
MRLFLCLTADAECGLGSRHSNLCEFWAIASCGIHRTGVKAKDNPAHDFSLANSLLTYLIWSNIFRMPLITVIKHA